MLEMIFRKETKLQMAYVILMVFPSPYNIHIWGASFTDGYALLMTLKF